MMPFSLRRTALVAAVGGVALGAFAFGWWGDADTTRRVFTDTAAAQWEPPKAIASDASAFAKILAQKSPFGSSADRANAAVPSVSPAAASAGTPAANWRIGGIVTTETTQYLVVLLRRPGENTSRMEIRRPGEELPDGSIVRTVEPTNAKIDRQGTIVTIKMFAQN
jgi:hypothetical protein